MNAKMAAAGRLTGDARFKAYSDLDIEITAKHAPWAAFLHRNERSFFSERMDPQCYQFQPVYTRPILSILCFK
jgi:hypothetical protein